MMWFYNQVDINRQYKYYKRWQVKIVVIITNLTILDSFLFFQVEKEDHDIGIYKRNLSQQLLFLSWKLIVAEQYRNFDARNASKWQI